MKYPTSRLRIVVTLLLIHFGVIESRAETFLLMEYVQADDDKAWLHFNEQMKPHLSTLTQRTDLVNRVVLRLWYPHPGERAFNYLILSEYGTWNSLQFSSSEFLQMHAADDPELLEILSEQPQLFSVVSREVTSSYWREHLVARSVEGEDVMGHLTTGDWAMVQYLSVDPDMWGPYSTMEEDIWKPIHEANVKKGRLKFWTLLGYYFESRKIDYDLLAVLVYPSFEGLQLNIYTHDTWTVVHGEDNDVFTQTFANRTQVQAQVWNVVATLRE